MKLRAKLHAIDLWMEHHLDLGEGMHWLSHHARPVGSALAVLAVLGYALSGWTRIGPDEVAVVRRFGRPVQDLGPGFSWRWPWPIEESLRVKPDRVHTVEIGFRAVPGAGATPAALAWSTQHEEALMITGDGNLVELQATVRYRIDRRKLHTYLFEVKDPDEIVRGQTESVLRAAVAGRPFLDLLTSARQPFVQDVEARLVRRCEEVSGQQLGIVIDGVSLHDLHPPQDVVGAFHDVIKAMQGRDRQINEAEAEARLKRHRKEVQARWTVVQAEAASNEKVLEAETERSRFLARLEARSQLPLADELDLLSETCSVLGQGQDIVAAMEDYQRRRRERVAAQAVLNDFRLFWDALGLVLKDRDAIVLDADKVPGRRHLFLFDLNQLRIPIPGLMPQGQRALPARGPAEEVPDEGG